MRSSIRFACIIGLCLAAALASAQVELIVRHVPGTTAKGLAKKYGLRLLDFTPNAPFGLMQAPNEDYAEEVEERMLLDPLVVWVEDDEEVSSPEGTSQRASKPQKGSTLPAVGDRKALYSYNNNALRQVYFSRNLAFYPGREVRIAILDTGLSPGQPALWANVVGTMNAIEPGTLPYDVPRNQDSNGNGVVDEAVGHGTMVTSIVDQVAPLTKLLIGRVADSDGNASAWTILKGLAFAVANGAEVANVSLGSLQPILALEDVVSWCEEKGMLVVAAAGNNGIEAVTEPAEYDFVLSVTAVTPENLKASFANYDDDIDVAAPGTGFAGQFWDGETAIWSGTSFATPIVAGGIADALRRVNRTTPSVLRRAIRDTRTSLDALNPEYAGELGGLLHLNRLENRLRNLVP